MMWYWIFKVFFSIILRVFFRLRVEGRENVPANTNFIVVANHASFLDPLCVMAALPCKIHCIAARYFFKTRLIKWFLERTDAFPTGGSSRKGFKLLTQNKVVGLFPEGKLSRDGNLNRFKNGAAILALKTGRPILPCALLGTFKALPYGAPFPRLFSPLKVRIGKPIYILKSFDDMFDSLCLQEETFRIKEGIKELLYAG